MYNIIIVLRALNHFFICYNLRHVYLPVECIKKVYYYIKIILVLGPNLCTMISVCTMTGVLKNHNLSNLPVRLKGNLNSTSSNYSLSPMGTQNKDLGAAS